VTVDIARGYLHKSLSATMSSLLKVIKVRLSLA